MITSLTRRWLQRNTVSFQKTENEGEAESDADQNSADVEKVPIIDPETSRRYMQSTGDNLVLFYTLYFFKQSAVKTIFKYFVTLVIKKKNCCICDLRFIILSEKD